MGNLITGGGRNTIYIAQAATSDGGDGGNTAGTVIQQQNATVLPGTTGTDASTLSDTHSTGGTTVIQQQNADGSTPGNRRTANVALDLAGAGWSGPTLKIQGGGSFGGYGTNNPLTTEVSASVVFPLGPRPQPTNNDALIGKGIPVVNATADGQPLTVVLGDTASGPQGGPPPSGEKTGSEKKVSHGGGDGNPSPAPDNEGNRGEGDTSRRYQLIADTGHIYNTLGLSHKISDYHLANLNNAQGSGILSKDGKFMVTIVEENDGVDSNKHRKAAYLTPVVNESTVKLSP